MRCSVSARSLRGKVRGVPHAVLNFHNVASTKITVVSYGRKTRSVSLSVCLSVCYMIQGVRKRSC